MRKLSAQIGFDRFYIWQIDSLTVFTIYDCFANFDTPVSPRQLRSKTSLFTFRPRRYLLADFGDGRSVALAETGTKCRPRRFLFADFGDM